MTGSEGEESAVADVNSGTKSGAGGERLTGEQARAWIIAFADRVADGAGELTDLDRRAGDGDFGWNLDTALGRVRTGLAEIGADHPAQVFQAVSDAFLASGGTSGPLFGLWFGRVAHGPEATWAVTDLATAFGVAADAVQRLGKAEVGHKTMVDAMVPAARSLAKTGTDDWRDALREAAVAAAEGARATEGMVARRGRASYLGDRAAEVIDPGALAVTWFFDSADRV